MLYHAALYCAVLCCTLLCCALLCCVVLRCAALCCTAVRCAVLYCAVLGWAVLCCAALCCAVLGPCWALLCCAALCWGAPPRPPLPPLVAWPRGTALCPHVPALRSLRPQSGPGIFETTRRVCKSPRPRDATEIQTLRPVKERKRNLIP